MPHTQTEESIKAIIKRLKGKDLAFDYSVENNDSGNMMMVLRAYGYSYGFDFAQDVIDAAR